MAQVGLKDLHFAKLTKDDEVEVTYAVPKKIAPAISVNMTTSSNSATLYADDGPAATDSALGVTEVTINTSDLPTAVEAELLGHTVNSEGVMVENADDTAPYVAIGFRSKTSDGGEMFVWLLKGKFSIPEQNYATKGESIEYQTPTITGQFIKRIHDGDWRYKMKSNDQGVDPTVISNWFTKVYEETPTP
ncbi:phage tail protein [Cytobacillus solani]|uniref:major tail protein n=1 Tax=Cytobacillus solani TaxID=1637975 RepID=UPI00207AC083|nr:major tail protein [Cytobacillus solani]USK56576.1 phage tail protein [Cytobacillus solani]